MSTFNHDELLTLLMYARDDVRLASQSVRTSEDRPEMVGFCSRSSALILAEMQIAEAVRRLQEARGIVAAELNMIAGGSS